MSRRKQANPRPLITVVGERGGQEEEREPTLSPCPSITLSENEQDLPNCDSNLIIDVPDNVFPASHLHQPMTTGMMLPVYTDESVSIIRPHSMSATPSETSHPSSPLNPSNLSNSYGSQSDLIKKGFQKILPVSLEDGNSCFVCPICQKELTTSHDLTIHIRSHNTSSSSQINTCTICGKILSSQSSLDRHMLVHSGERPFKCKICKMSFTTNGNMHRHSRIHKKDDLSHQGVKGGPRKAKGKMFNKTEIHPALLPSTLHSAMHMEKLLQGAGRFTLGVMNPDFKNYPAPDSFERMPMPPSVPMVQNLFQGDNPQNLYKEDNSENIFQGDNSHVVVKQEQDIPIAVSTACVSSEMKDGELHCPVCNKGFLCQVGLDSHLETHPNSPIGCSICNIILPNPWALSEHKKKEHSSNVSQMCDERESEESVAAGFSDLDFVNFSVNKFPLIAKSWCERNGRRATSAYHHYVCRFCSKAFPCKSALFLHMFIHNRQQLSTCPFCDCDFIGGAILHTHMLKHMSDTAISEAAPTMPQDIGKDHFLASLGIAAKENLATASEGEDDQCENSNWLSNLEKRDNMEYFGKLGQCFVPDIHKELQQAGLSVPPVEASSPSKMEGVKEDFIKDFSDFRNMVYLQAVTEGLPAAGAVPVWSAASRLHPSFPACLIPKFHPHLLSSSLNTSKDVLSVSMPSVVHDDASAVCSAVSSAVCSVVSSAVSGEENSAGAATGEVFEESLIKKEIPEIKDVFPCKYCDMVFSNYRSLKGHIRTHLGLSPYKCNLCSYSSADKSTLIRHLRTHNGERPFQCLICEFAFTTKANCERHVRKKHAKLMKKEIEDSIGYNKYLLESSSMVDSFHSPDTVCKYCGIDFKFFRALKHHLRSHSSCRQKPFLCQKCEVGFSTKANCVRHLQKQHLDIPQHQIESWIYVNEPSLMDDVDPSFSDSHDSVSPTESCDNQGSYSMSPSPPMAHHSQTIEHLFMKQELNDGGQPLDFSIKAYGQLSPTPSENLTSTDQPMDLSVKKSLSSSTPTFSKSELSSLLATPSCSLIDNKVQETSPCEVNNDRHKLSKLLTSNDNNNNSHKFWGMTSLLNATPIIGYPGIAASVLSQSLPARIKPPMETKIHSAFFRNFNHDNSDLASVNKIIDNTVEVKNFDFFRPVCNMDDDMDCDDDLVSCTSSVEMYVSRSGTPASPSLTPADVTQINNSGDNSQEKLEIIIKGETTPNGSLSPYGKQAAREEKRSDNTHDQSSPDSTSADSPGTGQDLTTPVKKKRNSYADSPHKLSCPCCPRSFPWISSLNRHLLTHTGQKPFKCPRCPVTFSTKSNRERHLIRKHGVNMLDPASRQTMDRPYKCHLCVFSSFATESNLLKHYQERHKGEKPSAESYLNFDSSPPYPTSDNEAADDFDISQTPGGSTGTNFSDEEDSKSAVNMRDCAMRDCASEGFQNDIDAMQSDETCYPSVTSDTEPKSDTAHRDITSKSDTAHRDITSKSDTAHRDITSKSDTTHRDIISKSDTAHRDIISKSDTVQRDISLMEEDEDMFELSGFSSDWKKMQINPERDNYNVDKITQCWKCGQEFPLRKLLVRHLKDHNIDLPFKCYLCDASFEQRYDCLQHQERFHPQDWLLLKDKNGVDGIDKFSTRMDKLVEKHCQGVASQGVEKNGQSVCVGVEEDQEEGGVPEDGITDTMTSDYQQRKVYCSLCPKRFWSLQDLRRHMRSHTGERPFECDVCFKRFTLKHSMMRHRKKHLGSMTPPLSDDEDNIVNSDDNVTSVLSTHGKNALRFHLSNQKKVSDSHSQILSNHVNMLQSSQNMIPGDNDLLHNLLGVEVSAIDKMLNSTDSANSAAQMLGV